MRSLVAAPIAMILGSPWSQSARNRTSGSSKTVVASSKDTPCLRRLLAAFCGSQSKTTRATRNQYYGLLPDVNLPSRVERLGPPHPRRAYCYELFAFDDARRRNGSPTFSFSFCRSSSGIDPKYVLNTLDDDHEQTRSLAAVPIAIPRFTMVPLRDQQNERIAEDRLSLIERDAVLSTTTRRLLRIPVEDGSGHGKLVLLIIAPMTISPL